MDEQNSNQKSIYQQGIDQQLPVMPTEMPPERSRNIFIIGGVIILIVLAIVVAIVFFFATSRTNTNQQSNVSALTPQPTPSFYQAVAADMQGQETKLGELGNDMKELDTVFTYESVNFSDVLTPPPVQTPEWESQKMEIAKARAELETDRRIAMLNKLGPKIDSSEKLSVGQKSQLSNEVASEISSIVSLKGRIAGHTNFGALIADINILSDSYKNYQVLVPKVLIVVMADKINVQGDTFTAIADKLAQKTGELQTLGKDVAIPQKTLGHMLFVMGDAANKAEAALISALPLSSSDYPKNKSFLQSAKSNLQASHKNLKSALSDARNILNTLDAIESGKTPSRNFFQFFPLFRF